MGVFQIRSGCPKIELEERHVAMFLSVQAWKNINYQGKAKKGGKTLKKWTKHGHNDETWWEKTYEKNTFKTVTKWWTSKRTMIKNITILQAQFIIYILLRFYRPARVGKNQKHISLMFVAGLAVRRGPPAGGGMVSSRPKTIAIFGDVMWTNQLWNSIKSMDIWEIHGKSMGNPWYLMII